MTVPNLESSSPSAPVKRRGRLGRSMMATLLLIGLAVLYWGVLASDRFVSESHVVIERTDFAASTEMDLGTFLNMGASTGSRDLLYLRDHLLSVDMMNLMEARLQLRKHFSDWRRDPLSRLWFEDISQEWFHRYYLSRVSVEMDDTSGVLFINTQAYTPEMAHGMGALLVEEGERFMNEIGHQLAREQVAFLEKQVNLMSERLGKARLAVLSYQNEHELVSPQATVEGISLIAARLESQLSEVQTKKRTMLGYLNVNAPEIKQINMQLSALEKQLEQERRRMASSAGSALNLVVETYQRLQLEAEFAQDVYHSALVGLEKGRLDAVRTLKKISVLQKPTLPQYAMEPRRLYNIVVFTLSVLLLSGIVHLLAAIIRDHKD